MENIFLTGEKGVGKSTIIEKLLGRLTLNIGGYMTERRLVNNILSFTVRSLYKDYESYPIARVNREGLRREIFRDSFTYHLPKMLDRDMEACDLIVLDELGFMENDIGAFTSKIYEILDSDKLVLGVLKAHDCEFLNNIRARDDVIIMEVTEDNRDSLVGEILSSRILNQ